MTTMNIMIKMIVVNINSKSLHNLNSKSLKKPAVGVITM